MSTRGSNGGGAESAKLLGSDCNCFHHRAGCHPVLGLLNSCWRSLVQQRLLEPHQPQTCLTESVVAAELDEKRQGSTRLGAIEQLDAALHRPVGHAADRIRVQELRKLHVAGPKPLPLNYKDDATRPWARTAT